MQLKINLCSVKLWCDAARCNAPNEKRKGKEKEEREKGEGRKVERGEKERGREREK